ncbi:MAG: Fur family transcriptional regulator [Anaerococcus vaginalis]|uniref:Transcriptional repressor n=1 Tax=Anaerococcus obesiensis TaxID=1287640 RepID=A0A7T7UT53_9FIRM|nr:MULTISPECIES: Fur family transcriptional regulator [Anaerococcus]MBS4888423.1 transcriptional repressor [Anaerococcus vaginalis]MDU0946380.1 Fur family transcriptional regulator [Anaerococcus vaginalis]MDU1030278.1 Fur family transcriptional regulator [Anaerococcus vaginalis]MDU2376118.1 Fur family transcriptional regulator [Anaerococcus vaginalis]MDU4378297.1 Fur family transcriptional regulator [Anaerococcus vaginalis]
MKEIIDSLENVDQNKKFEIEKHILKKHGIRVSHQRLMILDFLVNNRNHPTADDIYKNLKSYDPIISQATVYNTLNLFVENNIVSELDFNQSRKRYDFYQKNHSHFICEKCGNILDLNVDIDNLKLEELEGYKINSVDITIRGICPNCKK